MMEFESIKEAVKNPRKQKGEVSEHIEQWLETEDKTLRIKCMTVMEKRKVYSCCYQFRKVHGLDYTIFQKDLEVYLVRA